MIIKVIAMLTLALYLLPISSLCEYFNIDPDDLEYMAQVVEAESDRSEGCTRGKVYIAATILNRVESPYFKNTIRDVLNEPGQFSTTSNNKCYCEATQGSRYAVFVALIMIQENYIPKNILYFNCIGYNYGTAYDFIEGNYFMTYGG